MRETYTSNCGCGPIVGEIRNGLAYPSGAVKISALKEILEGIDKEFEKINGICVSLDKKNAVNEANITNNKNNISANKTAIDKIQSSLTQLRENVMALMNSIDKVDGKTEQNKKSISEISEKIDSLISDMNSVTAAVTKLQKDINGIESDFTATTNALSERIAALEGGDEMIVINSIAATPRTAELGSVVNVTINWNLSRPAKSADINGIDVTSQNMYVASGVSKTTEYKLSVFDEKDRRVTASAKIEFQNHIFWGVSADTNITETLVELLNNNVISDSKSRTISVSPNDQYVYYAYPKRLGTSAFRMGMLPGGFNDPVTIRITNSAGYAEDYYVYRSEQKFTYASVDFTIS